MGKLTPAQERALESLRQKGFVERRSSFGGSQVNGPYWKLVSMGMAVFGFGPKGSFLQTQGFMLPNAE